MSVRRNLSERECYPAECENNFFSSREYCLGQAKLWVVDGGKFPAGSYFNVDRLLLSGQINPPKRPKRKPNNVWSRGWTATTKSNDTCLPDTSNFTADGIWLSPASLSIPLSTDKRSVCHSKCAFWPQHERALRTHFLLRSSNGESLRWIIIFSRELPV